MILGEDDSEWGKKADQKGSQKGGLHDVLL
jgi:hypothetical protein